MRTMLLTLLFMVSTAPVHASLRHCHPAPCVGKHICPLYVICDIDD